MESKKGIVRLFGGICSFVAGTTMWFLRKMRSGYTWVRTHTFRELITELRNRAIVITAVTAIVAIAGYAFWFAFIDGNITKSAVVTVNGAEVKKMNGTDVYLIFTDKGEFKDVDDMWHLKWNSSKIYNTALEAVRKNRKLKITYNGHRLTWWSEYPNITSAVLLDEG